MAKSPTSFHLEQALLKRLRVACAERDISQSDAVTKAIEHWLNPNVHSPNEPVPFHTSALASEKYLSHNSETLVRAIRAVMERMDETKRDVQALGDAVAQLGALERGGTGEAGGGDPGGSSVGTVLEEGRGAVAQLEDWTRSVKVGASGDQKVGEGEKKRKKLPPRNAKGA